MRSLVVSHRGASFHAPENTLSAFLLALKMGADGIETDVQITKEGALVIHHNYTIDACSNGHGTISQMNLADLKTYDFGSYKGKKWTGERILTLDELLDATQTLKIVNIELKAPFDRILPYVQLVTDAILAHDMVQNVVISTFDIDLLREVKRCCPEIRVAVLTMPIGFTKSWLFSLLYDTLPRNKHLTEISLEDLPKMSESSLDLNCVGIPSADVPAAIMELAHQMGAVYPQKTLCEVSQALDEQADLFTYVKNLEFKPDYLHCHYTSVLNDSSLVDRLMQIGIGVSVWTPDKHEELSLLTDMGCTAIITNRPDILIQIQKK